MEKYKIKVEGTSPLLMNRPSALIGDVSADKKPMKNDPDGESKARLYITPDEKLYQPCTHFKGALVEAGKHKKVVGKGKATYSKIVGYAATIDPAAIIHLNQEWEIDSQLGVNPTTRGRVMIHRPMLTFWSLAFFVDFDETEVSAPILKELFDIAGRIVGVGDYRPAKKGPYGRFQVTLWEQV